MNRASESVPNLSETCAEPVSVLVGEAVRAGLALRVEAGELVVRGPRSRIELGRAVIARKAEVLAHLSALDRPWDAAVAVGRMEAADAAVARHGCRGSEQAIQAAVARAGEAYRHQDMAGLTRACDEVAALAAEAPAGPSAPRPEHRVGCPAAGEPPTLVATTADLPSVSAAVAASAGPVGLDTETTGLDHARHRVRLLQLATPGGTYLIDVFAFPDPATALAPVFAALAGAEVVGHHLGFDLPFLMRLGFAPGRVRDTMLASQVLHAGDVAAKHGLKDVAARVLGLTVDKEQQQADWSGPLTPAMLAYAALDAEVPLRAWPELAADADAAGLTGVVGIESAALPCVAWASTRGVGFDRPAWLALAAEADAERTRLREELDEAAPNGSSLFGARNWDSPEDVREALAAVGVELEATDDDSLAAVAHPLAGLIRDYRSAARLATTYGRDWLRHVAPDGRVYATWKQIGAGSSGRMSCKGPNLQQLPRDVRYRRCFAAPPGRALVKADYSQIELRIAAKVAKERRMLEAYQTGEDLHTLTAKALLGTAEVTKADRQLAKAVNFGLLYGQGADGLRRYARAGYGVELTEAEAVRHRETFFRTYPGLRAWHRSVGDGPADTRTLAGRRRLGVTRYTEKLNTPIQGCLQPHVRVLTDTGYTPIGELFRTGPVGRRVWTGTRWADFAVCNMGPCRFAQVALQDGTVLDCDTRHRLLVVTDDGYEWRGFADLRPGDRVATPLARPVEFAPPAPLAECGGVPVDAAFWYWVGYYYGNGHIRPDRGDLSYAFGPQPHRQAERAACAAFWRGAGANPRVRDQPRADRPGEFAYSLTVTRAALTRALGELGVGGGTAHTKRFPGRVFAETLAHRTAFARGFLAADGYLRGHPGENPSVHLCQRAMLADLKLLLRTLGVESVLRGPYRYRGHESYRLDIHRRMYEAALGGRVAGWPRLRGMPAPRFLVDAFLERLGRTPAAALPTPSAYTMFRRLHAGGTVSVYTLARLCEVLGAELDVPVYGFREVVWTRELSTAADTYTLAVDDPLHRYDSEGVISKNTGADGLKQALALLWGRRSECPDAFPVLVVHDEIVVECDAARQEEAAVWLRAAMVDGMAPLVAPVPVEVEVSAGPTWAG